MSSAFNGVKVFAATMVHQRQALGEQVTAWLEDAQAHRPGFQLVDIVVSQSSDEAFHCISVVLFFRECPPNAPSTSANAGMTSKEKTAIGARTATSNAAAVEILPTNVSANAPKKRQ